MKLVTYKTFLLILITISLAITASGLAAQVFKIVDEDGNVTYTDKRPKDGSRPIKLRPISVIEAPTYKKASPATEENSETEDKTEMPLRYLRKHYEDFAIVSPRPEQSIWNPQQPINVAWNSRYQLQQGMQVKIMVDGTEQATTSDKVILVSGLERGEHTVTAELKDANNRNIATAEPLTFFIRKPSVFINGPRTSNNGD